MNLLLVLSSSQVLSGVLAEEIMTRLEQSHAVLVPCSQDDLGDEWMDEFVAVGYYCSLLERVLGRVQVDRSGMVRRLAGLCDAVRFELPLVGSAIMRCVALCES